MKVVEYVDRDSIIHELDPRAILAMAVTVIVIGLLFDNPLVIGTVFLTVLALARVARVHPEMFQWLRLLLPFALFSFVLWTFFGHLSLAGAGSQTLVAFGPLRVSKTSLYRGLGMPLRLLVMITTPLFVLMTVRREALVAALVQLKVPYKVAFGFGLVLRMVDVFLDEIREIRHAQQARGAVLDRGGLRARLRANSAVLVPAVVRGVQASEDLAMALELKGFSNANNRSQPTHGSLSQPDYLVIGTSVVFTVGTLTMWLGGFA